MAVKRRIIWLGDAEWASLQQAAKERGDTASGVIRSFVSMATRHTTVEHDAEGRVSAVIMGMPPLPGFSTRPFTPVPKKGK